MRVDMNGVIFALSYALDCIEAEFVGVERNHAKLVAYLSTVIGKEYGLSTQELSDLSACAALHDNALTQYLSEERGDDKDIRGMHCAMGEVNVQSFPFRTDTTGFIRYHHENVDGTGPFGKRFAETPLQAHIIHMADMLDVACRFHEISPETYARIRLYLAQERDKRYDGDMIDRFFRAMPKEVYLTLQGRSVDDLLDEVIPHQTEEYSFRQVRAVMDLFGRIVDYKSPFTRNHAEQIARKIYKMAMFYGYDGPTAERLYGAGALHDIGKMAVSNDILEKPGRLTNTEFSNMQNHAWYTYLLLRRIADFADITRWASRHHEKLNGTGYPFGMRAENLDEKDRLVACVDIYQALREDRPYKKGMPHARCIEIMHDLAGQGAIDAAITRDIDQVFASEA